MKLYPFRSTSHLQEINPKPFKFEKEIQTLVEENLNVLFGLNFISTEFPLDGLRIDTLAFDQVSKAF